MVVLRHFQRYVSGVGLPLVVECRVGIQCHCHWTAGHGRASWDHRCLLFLRQYLCHCSRYNRAGIGQIFQCMASWDLAGLVADEHFANPEASTSFVASFGTWISWRWLQRAGRRSKRQSLIGQICPTSLLLKDDHIRKLTKKEKEISTFVTRRLHWQTKWSGLTQNKMVSSKGRKELIEVKGTWEEHLSPGLAFFGKDLYRLYCWQYWDNTYSFHWW